MSSRLTLARVRRVVTSAAALGVAASGIAGGAATASAPPAAPEGLIDEGVLSVCIDPEYPPMEYFEEGDTANPVGFDAAGATAVAAYWGLDVRWEITAFQGLMPALQAERCDVLWSALYISEERLEVADATPILATGPGLLVRAGDTSIASIDDLSGKTLAVQAGSANEQILVELSASFEADGRDGIEIQPYPQVSETVAAVSNERADALIETDVAVAQMVTTSGGALEEVPGVFEADTIFGVYVVKGSPLLGPLTAALRALDADGTLAAIAEEYGLDPSKIVTVTTLPAPAPTDGSEPAPATTG